MTSPAQCPKRGRGQGRPIGWLG